MEWESVFAVGLKPERRLELIQSQKNRGHVLYGAVKYAEAEAAYETARRGLELLRPAALTPELLEQREVELLATNLSLANVKLKVNKPGEALKYANDVMELRPAESDALMLFAELVVGARAEAYDNALKGAGI